MSIYPEKLGYVACKKETTYNTDPTIAIPGDLLYCEELSHDQNYEMAARTGDSPKRAGFRMVKTNFDGPISLTVELDQYSVTGDSAVPVCDPILHCCGFERTPSTGGENKTQTYLLQTAGHGSSWFEIAEINEDEDDCAIYEYGGVRGDWTLSMPGDGLWTFAMDGNSASGTYARKGSGPDAGVDYDGNICELPAVGGGCVVVISVLDGDTTYPIATASLHSAEFSGNMGLQAKNTLAGRKITLVPTEPVGGSLTLEQVDFNEGFDPYDIRNNSKVFTVFVASKDLSFTGLVPANDGTYVCVYGSFVIADFAKGLAMGARTWEINLAGAYPESSADGGGLDPADDFRIIFGEFTAA